MTNHSFTALKVEGAIAPPDLLQQVAAQNASHQENGDYGISRSLSIKDEIGRYWRIANDLWRDFQERYPRKDLNQEKVAVQDWAVSFCQQVLGYPDLQPIAHPIAVGERLFPINYSIADGKVPLLLCPPAFNLDTAYPRFGYEHRRRSPQGLIQEYLNATEQSLWGVAFNGHQMRLLRDNPSLTRPAYIEADLQVIFEEQIYADFATFWLFFHASRLLPQRDGTCILEGWRQKSYEIGKRALTNLRLGVVRAIDRLCRN
jgi:hypothetical protein